MTHMLNPRIVLAGLIGILIGALAISVVWSQTDNRDAPNEARVAARTLADGRIEVALQQQTTDGWSERQRPDSRFLSPDAEADRWYASSALSLVPLGGPLQVAGPHALGPWNYPNHLIATPTRPVSADTLFCIVAHGTERDSFWQILFESASTSSLRYGINMRASVHPQSSDQADAVRQCIEDGAAVVATTLADPAALRPALLTAVDSGTRIVTFNSGIGDADSVHSGAHIRLDETAAGRLAAEQFNRIGEGGAICVIHEAVNVGLQERCDTLEAHYRGGSVSRLNIGVLADDERADAIADAVGPDTRFLLTLNYNTTEQAVDALHRLTLKAGHEILIGAIGSQHPTLPAMVALDLVSFAIWDQPAQQGFMLPPIMLMVHGLPSDQRYGLITSVRDIVINPQLVTKPQVDSMQTDAYRAANPHLSRIIADAITLLSERYGLDER